MALPSSRGLRFFRQIVFLSPSRCSFWGTRRSPCSGKFTSIIMASKLFAMLASWIALSRPMADFSRSYSGCLSHKVYVLAEGGCGHITTNWGLLYSEFGFWSYHTCTCPSSFKLSHCIPNSPPIFLQAEPPVSHFLRSECCQTF